MRETKLWKFIAEKLSRNQPVMFMCVVESRGSSPGRQGFKMAVTGDEICGSVGGGIMEHKFVALAKENLHQLSVKSSVKKQFHQKNAAVDQSGMICSGEQTILLFPLQRQNLPVIEKIVSVLVTNQHGFLQIAFSEFDFYEDDPGSDGFNFMMKSESDFNYTERLGYQNHLYVIGGGHCALALSKLMRGMDFYIHLFEEREGLNTMEENNFAHEKKVVRNYAALSALIPSGENNYVTVMTFGYRTDDEAVRTLVKKKFRYFGVLGSDSKIKRLFAEWRADGISEDHLKRINSPIGIQIGSETPEEIAVSIAAEIIRVKNDRDLENQ